MSESRTLVGTMPRPVPLRAERLLLLPNHAMRARRCPKAILALWGWEALLGGVLAWPFTAIVRSSYGSHPRADEVLWEPGGLPLLDLLVRRLPALPPLFAHAVTVVLFAMIAGLLPLAALLVGVGFTTPDRKPPSLKTAIQSAIPSVGPFLVLLAATLALQASLLAAVLVGAGLAEEGFERKLGEVGAGALAVVILGLGIGLVAAVGVIEDVARAAIVRFGIGAGEGLRTGLATMAKAPLALLWSWGWRGLASLVPIAFGLLLAGRLGGRGGSALVVLFLLHQLIVAVRAALRVSWLARAMRAVDARGRG
jgi:hypothetical protein